MNQAAISRGRGLLLVVLATACWATSGIFVSLILNSTGGISPWGLAFWRDLGTLTCLVSGMVLLRPDLLRVKRADLPWLGAMGAISIGLFHVMWNTSVLLNGVSVATVFQSNAPIFVAIMAWLLWREPLTWRKIAAIVLAVSGTVLISGLNVLPAAGVLSRAQISWGGMLVGVGTAVAFGGFSLFGKKLTGFYSPWTVLVYVFGFGTLTLLPFQLWTAVPWPPSLAALGGLVGLVLLPTISGFALYTSGLRRLQASVAAIVATAEVPFAAVVSYLVLGERLDGWQVLGAVLVISGVVLLSWPRERVGSGERRAWRVKRGLAINNE